MLKIFDTILNGIFALLPAYMTIYTIVGIFFTKKFKETDKKYKYAFIVPARNEEIVIGNLIDSIKKQNYPLDLMTIFVVADNCDDRTAEIAKEHGAIVYERFHDKNKTKGYALQYIFEEIRRDYGLDTFDGYFIFDSDNLLMPNYVEKMNEAFASGEKIITSFRNSKNIETNYISSMTAMHYLRYNRFFHRPRSFLGLSGHIQGTGFLFASEVIKDGWNFTDLTENRSFTVSNFLKGYKISYHNEAEFFDEQPTTFLIAQRQRIRWAKGNLVVGFRYFKPLVKAIFNKKSTLKENFNAYDMLITNMPLILMIFAWNLFYFLYRLIRNLIVLGIGGLSFWVVIKPVLISMGTTWLVLMIQATYVFIIDKKRIQPLPFLKKVMIVITWPLFDLLEIPTKTIALFSKNEWKPIPHKDGRSVSTMKIK